MVHTGVTLWCCFNTAKAHPTFAHLEVVKLQHWQDSFFGLNIVFKDLNCLFILTFPLQHIFIYIYHFFLGGEKIPPYLRVERILKM